MIVAVCSIRALAMSLETEFTLASTAEGAIESAIDAASKRGEIAFGVLLPEFQPQLATLKAAADQAASLVKGDQSDAVKRLPVTLLQALVMEQRLGIDAAALAADPVHAVVERNLA